MASENVVAARVIAFVIDGVLLLVVLFMMPSLFGANGYGEPALFRFGIIGFGYFFLTELFFGQTLGKKVMNLRVVSESGPLTPGKVALRTALRVADVFVFGLVGLVAVVASKKHQRIGDMVAHTLVVRG